MAGPTRLSSGANESHLRLPMAWRGLSSAPRLPLRIASPGRHSIYHSGHHSVACSIPYSWNAREMIETCAQAAGRARNIPCGWRVPFASLSPPPHLPFARGAPIPCYRYSLNGLRYKKAARRAESPAARSARRRRGVDLRRAAGLPRLASPAMRPPQPATFGNDRARDRARLEGAERRLTPQPFDATPEGTVPARKAFAPTCGFSGSLGFRG